MKYRKCEICGIKTERKEGHKRFFMARFPLEETRCKKWVKVTGNEDLVYVPIEKLHDNKFVCGKHFTDRDFKKKRTQLKKYAVPSIRLAAQPLSDEILSVFPFHVHPTNSGEYLSENITCDIGTENKPNATTATATITSNTVTCDIVTENKPNATTATATITSNTVASDLTNENEPAAITTPATNASTGRVYSEEEIPVVANSVDIHSSGSVVATFYLSDETHKHSKEMLHTEISTKEKALRGKKSNKSCTVKKGETSELTPRKKKLLKKINRYKTLLKQFRVKVKELNKIQSPALKTFLKTSIKNQGRHPRGRRWSNDEKGLALAIYKKSPRVYRYFKQIMLLPSERTLQSILQKLPMEPGWNELVLGYLKKHSEELNVKEKTCVILFDEMSLKKRFIYNPRLDKIEGYQDLGSHGRSSDVADKALVFMLQGVYKKIKQPLGHFFVKGTISSQKLAVLIKEAIKKVTDTGFRVLGTVCDQGPTNVGGINLLKQFSGLNPDENHFFVNDQKILIIYDVPHLFKNIRNNFMQAQHIKFDGKVARWSHIQEICQRNTSTLHFKKITPLHINPTYRSKMKVKLAAQILSNTVKAILLLLSEIYREERETDGRLKRDAIIETANVVHELDLLFDCTNGPASSKDRKKGIRENVHKNSNHHTLWSEYKRKIKTTEFLKSDSRIRLGNVRCTKGYYITLCSLQDIWKVVSEMGFKYLNLRQLNQDSLENLFGIIRQHCPTNQNPTCHHFTAALKSTILTRLNTPLRGSNCEKDGNGLILDFNDVAFHNSVTEDDEHCYSAGIFNENVPEIDDTVTIHIPDGQDTIMDARIFAAFENQPLVYVSGYIALAVIRRIHLSCSKCLCSLTTDSPGNEEMYKYIDLNEWQSDRKLTYPTINLCSMVADTLKVFEEEVRPCLHETDIASYCRVLMLKVVDSSWICDTHSDQILEQLLVQISSLLIRNECKKMNQHFSEKEELCADFNKKAQVLGFRK